MSFQLVTKFKPSGDQPKAIEKIIKGFKTNNFKSQVLVGATGTGKTFTMANIIQSLQKKTLVLAHNKTLAAQLYSEFKEMFPNNRVEYFVSTFDFYQPEAYIPKSNTYIEKNSQSNKDIEMLTLSALNSLTQDDFVIVVASVASIYSSISPIDFIENRKLIKLNDKMTIKELQYLLVGLNYERNDYDVTPGKFSIKGDVVEIGPGFTDQYNYRLSFFGDEIENISEIEPLTKKVVKANITKFFVIAADTYLANKNNLEESLKRITKEMFQTIAKFKSENKLIEAQRIEERTRHDIDSLKEFGYCTSIENYSRHLEFREEGQTPYTIFDYFGKDWLLIVDESHMMVPQIRGMYNTDRSRKETLVEYGFRLPSALDNRPLNFNEFLDKISKVLYVSATPNEWEISQSSQIIEQIIRPTGLVDPVIEIRPTKDQIIDIENEIRKQIKKNERTFVTVMTIRMAEELASYLKDKNIKVAYLHNELKTIDRFRILNNLRKGIFDVVVGINLLREGLDLPEVSLVLILDADKPGFFRSDKSLIQIIGRASRNVNGKVIMYGDEVTEAMTLAINETNRRRNLQIEFNKKNNIVPKTIIKPIAIDLDQSEINFDYSSLIEKHKKSKLMRSQTIERLRKEMLDAAKNQEYERAIYLRDMIIEIEAAK